MPTALISIFQWMASYSSRIRGDGTGSMTCYYGNSCNGNDYDIVLIALDPSLALRIAGPYQS